MVRQFVGTLRILVPTLLLALILMPGNALAQRGGSGGKNGGPDNNPGDNGNGNNQVQSLQVLLTSQCEDDPDASGQAVYTTDRGGLARTMTVQINTVVSTDVVTLCLNGTFVAFLYLDPDGNGSTLTGAGYYGTGVFIPLINPQDELEVYDPIDGTLILVGTFQ